MSIAGTYRELLRNGPLTRLLLGEFVSSIGDWLYLVALVVLVYRETEDPIVLGIVGAVRMLPYLFLSIPAGVITDRFDRRMVLLVTDLARAGCMLVMAWLVATDGPLVAIAVVALVAACFSTFFYPAIGALLPSLVQDERQFGPANSAWATLDNFAWIVGPGIAGVLLATGDIVLAFVLNAISFLVIAVVLWTLPRQVPGQADATAAARTGEADARPTTSPDTASPTKIGPGVTPATNDLAAGASAERAIDAATGTQVAEAEVIDVAVAEVAEVAEVGSTVGPGRLVLGRRIPASIDLSAVAGVVLLDTVMWFAFGGIGILIVVIAVDVFQGGDAATGYLNGAIGIGGTIGALLSGALVLRPRLGGVLVAGAVAFGAATLVLGLANQLMVAFLAIGVISIGNLVLDVTRTTIFQRSVPDAWRGRFTGVLMTTQVAAESAGTLVMPMLMVALGFGVTMGITGIAVIVGGVAAVRLIGSAADVAAGPYDADLRRIARLSLFGGLTPAKVEGALRGLDPIHVAAGDVIVRQGEPADRFYVIGSGAFEVTQAGPDGGEPRHLRTLGVDAVFGERGLLGQTPRTATVSASTDGLLFAMDGDTFLRLVGARPAVRDRLMALYSEPVVDTAARG